MIAVVFHAKEPLTERLPDRPARVRAGQRPHGSLAVWSYPCPVPRR